MNYIASAKAHREDHVNKAFPHQFDPLGVCARHLLVQPDWFCQQTVRHSLMTQNYSISRDVPLRARTHKIHDNNEGPAQLCFGCIALESEGHSKSSCPIDRHVK